eukprot:m.177903 g.177903  ORF g.177903 m.177903 type:complete len:321 (-) comp53378_c0_seq16:1819-2781(-)
MEALLEADRDKQGKRARNRNWNVDEYFVMMQAASVAASQDTVPFEHALYEEYERISKAKGVQYIHRDEFTLQRSLEHVKAVYRFVQLKTTLELGVQPSQEFIQRKGSKTLWNCFRDPAFRELCDPLMKRIDPRSGTLIRSAHATAPLAPQPPPSIFPLDIPAIHRDDSQRSASLSSLSHPSPSMEFDEFLLLSAPSCGSLSDWKFASAEQFMAKIMHAAERQNTEPTKTLSSLIELHMKQLENQKLQSRGLSEALNSLLSKAQESILLVSHLNKQMTSEFQRLFEEEAQLYGAEPSAQSSVSSFEDADPQAKRRKQAQAP